MNAQHNTQPNQNSGVPLTEINAKLNMLGINSIDVATARAMTATTPKDRILKAIDDAFNDQAALEYLNGLITAATASGGGNNVVQHNFNQNNQQPHQNNAQGHDFEVPQGTFDEPQKNPDSNQDREFLSYHVYGGKAALSLEVDQTKNGFTTLALDGAPSIGQRKYDWQKKTRIQMTKEELPVVLATLLGFWQGCEYKNHGPANNKGFSMERQAQGKLFVKVFEADNGVKAVPVDAVAVFHLASIAIKAMQSNYPWMDSASIIQLAQQTAWSMGN